MRTSRWPPRSTARLIFAGIAVVALVLAGKRVSTLIPAFTQWVDTLGTWGPLAFILAYAVGTVLFVPGSLLTLAAGALFGLLKGTAYVFIGATLGEAGAFLVARHFARGLVERRLARTASFATIDAAIGRAGWRIVLLLRLSPIVPFNLLNYALGVSKVRLRDFLLASPGILPGTLLYVYYGQVAGEVAAVAGGAAPARGAGYYAVLGLGLAATLAATVLISRTARRALLTSTQGTPV